MNTTEKKDIKDIRPVPGWRKYIPFLIIIFLVIGIVLLLISQYNKTPEPIPQTVTDTAVSNKIPPDSLHH